MLAERLQQRVGLLRRNLRHDAHGGRHRHAALALDVEQHLALLLELPENVPHSSSSMAPGPYSTMSRSVTLKDLTHVQDGGDFVI